MNHKIRMVSIIIFTFILIYFLLVSNAFAAENAAVNRNSILNEQRIKATVQEVLVDFGRTFFRNLTQSLGGSVPAQKNDVTVSPSRTGALQGKKIVIDPGHGGSNPGAVRYNLREADNNLAVGLRVKNLLEQQGARVILTRNTDQAVAKAGAALREELQARVDIAQRSGADALISIHTNSNENTAIKGAMTFYYHEASKALAQNIQTQMIQATSADDKGIAHGDFLVLRNSSMPAVLVEMGFITHETEALKLNEDAYRARMAAGISAGISQWFSIKP